MIHSHHYRGLVSALLGLTLVVGCQKKDPIRRYKAAKPVVVDAENRGNNENNPPLADPAVDEAKSRMLTATFVNNDDVWFFKLVGDSKPVGQLQPAFTTFIRSVQFKENQPDWKLPEGWKEKRATDGGIRFSTITIGEPKSADDEKLELTITRLDMPLGADVDGVLLNNINRWRRQMSLAAIKRNRLFRPPSGKPKDGVVMTEWTGTHRIYFADLAGSFSSQGPMGMPPNTTSPPTTAPPPSDEFTYSKPDSWKPGRMNAFRKAAFQLTDSGGSQTAEITVSVAGGDLLANVIRWRGQIGLGSMSQEEMEAAFSDVPVGKEKGKFITLESKPKSILVVILERDGQKWFFKLTGLTSVAMAEKSRFLKFVESFAFK